VGQGRRRFFSEALVRAWSRHPHDNRKLGAGLKKLATCSVNRILENAPAG
jgi:hypothetical protein